MEMQSPSLTKKTMWCVGFCVSFLSLYLCDCLLTISITVCQKDDVARQLYTAFYWSHNEESYFGASSA